jgi:hypothetical protein
MEYFFHILLVGIRHSATQPFKILKIGNVKVIRQRLVSRVSTEQGKSSGMAVRVSIACKITFSNSQGCRSRKKVASMFFFQTFLNGGNLSYIIFSTDKFANLTVNLKRFNLTNKYFMKLIHHLRNFNFFKNL